MPNGSVGGRVEKPRPSRRTLVLLVAPIVALSIAGTIANAFLPTLVKNHPLALVALEPRNRNLVLVAPRVDALPFIVIAVIRRFLSDPLFFLLGHFYGEGAVRWIEKKSGGGAGIVRTMETLFHRASWPMVFFFPGALVCVLAGATGMRVRTFLILNVSGTIFAVTMLRLFAKALETPVEALLRFNDRYVWPLTITTIVITVFYVAWQSRTGGADLSVRKIGEEIEGDDEA